MKLIKNKGFKTIILTKKSIIVFGCIILLLIILLLSGKGSSRHSVQYTSTEDFHNVILASELNSNSLSKEKVSNAIKKVFGFDLGQPETILYKYSSQFYEIESNVNPGEVIYPTLPAATQAPKSDTPIPSEEKPIEEISASKGLAISNNANIAINPNELIKQNLTFSLDSDTPQILILHTHTTEAYTDSGKTKYTVTDNDRSTDETKNMTAVGNELSQVLEEKGIKVIHDTTVHDYPAYNGSYNRSKATALENLNKYPSIKMILDIHRDGIIRADGTKIKVACDIDGKKTAQCMFVVGSNKELTHDNWLENMKLACKLQKRANELYPGLMRPINLRNERFNQQLSTGALIIEIGSNGNTLDEAIIGARLMGNTIASLFSK